MKIQTNNDTNFGAIRVKTGYFEAGKKARNICSRIERTFNTKGHIVYPEADVIFFHNSLDENKAERILLKENVDYLRDSIADIADTFTVQDWAQTGNSNILMNWYLKHRKDWFDKPVPPLS